MAIHLRRWLAPENLQKPYHDEMHRQSHHQKFVTKPNLRATKHPSHSDSERKNSATRNEGRHVKFKSHQNSQQRPQSEAQSASPAYGYTPPDYYYIVNATEPPTLEQIAAERERIRIEFFSTYDVMTGVRIATTLGGFFGLMVFLVIYKSRGERIETMNALKDPKIAAVAAAVMQEEENRELQEALEATGLAIYPDDYIEAYPYRTRTRMMSLGNVSAPPTLNQCGRFSSISGYNSLIKPVHRRFSYAGSYRKSNSVESSRLFCAYPIDESFDYYIGSDGEEADDEFDQITSSNDVDDRMKRPQPFAQKSPQPERESRRRCSNITCCSSESSYLERRCSAITLGLSPLPAISSQCPSTANIWDLVHQHNCQLVPPDIQLIQATPRVSPNSSERTHDQKYYCFDNNSGGGGATAKNRRWKKNVQRRRSIDQDSFDSTSTFPERNRRFCYDEIEEEDLAETTVLAQQINKLGLETRCLDDTMFKYTLPNAFETIRGRAPLASISSLKISSIDYQDSDLRSPISDSLFEETYGDTDDDLEPFSLDSDDGKNNGKTLARIERTDIDASTSITNKSIAMQTSFTGLNMDPIDLNQETICEIDEIGPQAQQTTNRICSSSTSATVAASGNTLKQLPKMSGTEGSSGSGNGSVNFPTNNYSRSTGNMTQESAPKLDKSNFSSEPLNLHFRSKVDVQKEKPVKLPELNSKPDIHKKH